MYRTGRHSVRERIIAAEVMKLERRQAAARHAGEPSSHHGSSVRAADAHIGKRALTG